MKKEHNIHKKIDQLEDNKSEKIKKEKVKREKVKKEKVKKEKVKKEKKQKEKKPQSGKRISCFIKKISPFFKKILKVVKGIPGQCKKIPGMVKRIPGNIKKIPGKIKSEIQRIKREGIMITGIQNKIFVCFLVPILFMIIVGFMSYKKAANGMMDTFKETTQQTIAKASDYIGLSNYYVESEVFKYATDKSLAKYFKGSMLKDPSETREFMATEKNLIMASTAANEFIDNVYLMPAGEALMISTVRNNQPGVFDEYVKELADEEGNIDRWVDHHDVLDETLSLDQSSYILSCQMMTTKKNALVIIDVKASKVMEFLQTLNLGEGTIVGFVTAGGRELVVRENGKGEMEPVEGETIFPEQQFYQKISEDGASEVRYNGKKYLFIHSTSEETGATVCALIPMKLVTGQADSIKQLTLIGVILSGIIAILIGMKIASGIRGNMRSISGRLKEVAAGNLTTQVSVKGKDEFNQLAAVANDMIANNKKLVLKVSKAAGTLEQSAGEMSAESGMLNEHSQNITQAIDEINTGMAQQAAYAQKCVENTDTLSTEIQEINRIAQEVENLVEEAERMISKGMEFVAVLGERAAETTTVTSKVEKSMDALQREISVIDEFAETISSISKQTNLLSLNASIEAARAGESGRGFAVVAEEIRNLAVSSAKAAGEISKSVSDIDASARTSVQNAKQAGEMVALQSDAVTEVISVFQTMNAAMENLFASLKNILVSTEQADNDRKDTIAAVENISKIIEDTAVSTEVVARVAAELQNSVESLNGTARQLDENMSDLANEISVFKTE